MPGASQGEIRNEELRCGPVGRDWDGEGALPQVSQGTISALRAGTSYFVLRNVACGRQCSHRPAGFAVPQTPSGGRERPPYRLT